MSQNISKGKTTELLALKALDSIDTKLEFVKQKTNLGIVFPHQLYGKGYSEWADRFTEDEKRELGAAVQNISSGTFSVMPLICPGANSCPHGHICPFAGGNEPFGLQCLTGDTQILMSDGTYKSLIDVSISDSVMSLNISAHEFESDTVTYFRKTGLKEVFLIKTKFGHKIKCTSDHPIWTVIGQHDRRFSKKQKDKSKEIKDLEHKYLSIDQGLFVKSRVAVVDHLSINSTLELIDQMKFLGLYLSDGYSNEYQFGFSNTNRLYVDEFAFISRKMGSKNRTIISRKQEGKKDSWEVLSNSNRGKDACQEFLKKVGLWNKKEPEKFIPEIVFKSSRSSQEVFLNYLWAGDGWVSKTGQVGILQESKEFIKDIQKLLWLHGIHSHIYQSPSDNGHYRLLLSTANCKNKFLKEIGPIFGKENQCKLVLGQLNSNIKSYNDIEKDVLWDQIISIESLGEQEVFDITIENNKNFIANGIVVHNCPVEQQMIANRMHGLMHEHGIDGSQATNFMLLNRLVELELTDFRCSSLLSSPSYNQLMRTVITGSTSDGTLIENEAVNPLIETKERISREKMKLMSVLVSTPEAKYKKQAALKEVKSDEYSNKIASIAKGLMDLETKILAASKERDDGGSI